MKIEHKRAELNEIYTEDVQVHIENSVYKIKFHNFVVFILMNTHKVIVKFYRQSYFQRWKFTVDELIVEYFIRYFD